MPELIQGMGRGVGGKFWFRKGFFGDIFSFVK